jgi:BirA family biotin operon repressor/biotin-[acetyl-CoA-carboxylase] ligase
MHLNILRFETIGSTNTEALEQARRGAAEGLCVVARAQTAGRGRHGRAWQSPPEAGLYFSIVLRPKFGTARVPLLTLMAAVAVSETLRAEAGIESDIKWVNDLLVGDKKICGILAETAETESGTAVVVGIGINLRAASYDPQVASRATSVETETGRVPDFGAVLERLTGFLTYFYAVLAEDDGARRIIGEWSARSTYFRGKAVRVDLGNETVTGTTDGLEPNGALRLITDDGLRIIQAGDVERLRNEGPN